MIDEPNVLLDINGALATITLNRPRVLNAHNEALVLVRGAGRSFSSGLDLNIKPAGVSPDFFERSEQTRLRLESLDAITIAAVQGHCLGGGLQLAIACDIRVSSSDAQFGLPAALEGLFPGLATVRLPRLIGLGPARRLILSGELIDAHEGLRLGMVDYVVPADRFESHVSEVVHRYLRIPPDAAAASKTLMRRAFDTTPAAASAHLNQLMAKCLAAPESAAAITAWRERRDRLPSLSGRSAYGTG